MRTLIIVFALLGASIASAGTLQYNTSNLDVTGYAPSGTFDTQSGRATLTVGSEPAWNAPGGCALDTRQPWRWTRLVTVSPLVLQLNPTLIFFQCTAVSSLEHMRTVMKAKVDGALSVVTGANKDITVSLLAVLAFGQNACDGPPPVTTGNCGTIRSNNTTIGLKLGTLADIVTLQTSVISIFTEFNNVKTAQGW
jgi:hypothetical protein